MVGASTDKNVRRAVVSENLPANEGERQPFVHFSGVGWWVRDGYGNVSSGLANKSSDVIHVDGMQRSDGELVHFESDSFDFASSLCHLSCWCDDLGFAYGIIRVTRPRYG